MPYDKSDLYSPVIQDITVHACFGLMLLVTWLGLVVDVKAAFLHGEFKPQHHVYMFKLQHHMYMKIPK